jgi:hypothetical protein
MLNNPYTEEQSFERDEKRLNAAKKAFLNATSDWAHKFWSDVYFRLQKNMKIRALYNQVGGSEKSPLNPILATWNH